MKILFLRQPWAWAIMHAAKDVENRDWVHLPRHRGDLLIGASAGCTRLEYEEARAWILDRFSLAIHVPDLEDLPRGGIVGRVQLAGVIDGRLRAPAGTVSRWYVGPVGLVLADPKPCRLHPLRGQLGIYESGVHKKDLVWLGLEDR